MTKKGFIKIASAETLAVAVSDNNTFNRTAGYENNESSDFLTGRKSIDLKEKLAMLADEYDISPNPEDYIFEAIRGNTSNVANENKDAFHKHELLRFDHRLGKQVYRTYENKPHHINHRADNPRNARGFIVDAHYNDSSPPLDECPNPHCGNKTASAEGRDPETGIHCRKCGEVVKDEFVELLVAIDSAKDPSFANGVKSGVLRHGSMGCSCVRTRCNVCGKVAYTRSEFCNHIARNKGKVYDDSDPDFNPIAFIIQAPKDKTAGKPRKIAKAFEWCEGVVFDEYSRVHDPADVKAEQYEILQLSAKVAQLEKEDVLRNESELLVLQSRLSNLEKKVDSKLASIQKAAQLSPQDLAPVPTGGAPAPGAPPSPTPETSEIDVSPEDEDSDVTINVNVGKDEDVEVGASGPLEPEPALGTPIEDLTPEAMGLTPTGPGQQMSPASAGLSVPPAPQKRGSKEGRTLSRALDNLVGGPTMLRFANSYRHLQAEITSVGNIRIFDKDGTLFVVKPDSIPNNSKAANKSGHELAKTVLTMIAEYGLGGAIKRTSAIVGPRVAQVLEHYMDDMLNLDRNPESSSILDNAEKDSTEKRTKDKKTETATGIGEETDAKDKHETKDYKKDDSLEGRETDLEDEQHDRDPKDLSSTDMHDSDKRDDRKDWDMGQSALDDVTLDHQEKHAASNKKEKDEKKEKKDEKKEKPVDAKKHAARLEALYNKRLESKVAEIEKEKDDYLSSFTDRFVRAMKIVARRQALNLEHSPIKEAMTEALLNPRPLAGGFEYEPMDENLAVNLVEASINEPLIEGTEKAAWEAHIDGLIQRTSEVMKMNDETLMQIESDLSNMVAMSIPTEQPSRPRTASRNNEDLRQQMTAGNLQLATGNSERVAARGNKRDAIRSAVGATKVASSKYGFGI